MYQKKKKHIRRQIEFQIRQSNRYLQFPPLFVKIQMVVKSSKQVSKPKAGTKVAAGTDRSRSRSQSKPTKVNKPVTSQPRKSHNDTLDLGELLGAGSASKGKKTQPAQPQQKKHTAVHHHSPAPAAKTAPKKKAEPIDFDEILGASSQAKPAHAKTHASPARKVAPAKAHASPARGVQAKATKAPAVQAKATSQRSQSHDKLSHFMTQLRTRDGNDVKSNATLLASIINTFAQKNQVSAAEIIHTVQGTRKSGN